MWKYVQCCLKIKNYCLKKSLSQKKKDFKKSTDGYLSYTHTHTLTIIFFFFFFSKKYYSHKVIYNFFNKLLMWWMIIGK